MIPVVDLQEDESSDLSMPVKRTITRRYNNSYFYCIDAIRTKTVVIIILEKRPFLLIQLYGIALAVADIGCPAFKYRLAARANFIFMFAHRRV